MTVSCFDPHLTRVRNGEITVVSCQKNRVAGGYSIYGYRCIHVTFSDGTHFSTGNWMYPDTPKSIREVEEAFDIKLGETRTKEVQT